MEVNADLSLNVRVLKHFLVVILEEPPFRNKVVRKRDLLAVILHHQG